MSNAFGSFGSNPSQQSTGLFGSLDTGSNSTIKPNSLGFGQSTNPLAQSQTQPQQSSSLFGGLNQANQAQQPQSNTAFGASAQNQQGGAISGSSLFNTGIFRSTGQTQQQQPQFNPLGNAAQAQPLGNSILGGNLQQQPQQGIGLGLGARQTQQLQPGSILGQSSLQQSAGTIGSLWQPGSSIARQKTIPEQLVALGEKWSSASPSCVFRRYFYNHVGENRAPYYRPSPGEDERKWEEALAKKPGPGYIPVLGVGFEQLGIRLSRQVEYLAACNVRLHEINDALTAMLHKHELIISVRILEARRKHQTLSHRCLVLATKVQVLRNRGYAMSGDEEELKRKLVNLERGVFDPALGGRSEEIWARMVSIRERTRALHEEMERSVKGLMNGQPEMLDEEVMKKAAKVLEDYAGQLAHLRKELEQIQGDFKEWENLSKPNSDGNPKSRS